MNYRRARQHGGTYFFTLVTNKQRKFLCEPENVDLLREAFTYVMQSHPFVVDAHVILPEHLHFIWTLPDGDQDFSTRWRLIKGYFSRNCADQYKIPLSSSRQKRKEQMIWQRRFWEHKIKDQNDFNRHVEYIHYNPVKHGLVAKAGEWGNSSFRRYVEAGVYESSWGVGEEIRFGENVGRE